MAKYYILKVKGTWFNDGDFLIGPNGLDLGYFVGPDMQGRALVSRQQHEAVRYTKKMVKKFRKEAGDSWPKHLLQVPLSTKASRLKKRAESSAESPHYHTVYIETRIEPNVRVAFNAEDVLDILAVAGI